MDKLRDLEATLGRERIRLALPPLTRKWEEHGLLLKVDKLRSAGFYSEWKGKYGDQAWELLEKSVGKLS